MGTRLTFAQDLNELIRRQIELPDGCACWGKVVVDGREFDRLYVLIPVGGGPKAMRFSGLTVHTEPIQDAIHVGKGHAWWWNGDRAKPTLQPSIAKRQDGVEYFHGYITAGVLE